MDNKAVLTAMLFANIKTRVKGASMNIIPMSVSDERILRLFFEHDDFMLCFMGEDRGYYTRYSDKECIEKVWAAVSDDLPIGCVAYRQQAPGVGEIKRLFIKKDYRGNGYSKELLNTVEGYAKKQGAILCFWIRE